jgi:hypothetical protein
VGLVLVTLLYNGSLRSGPEEYDARIVFSPACLATLCDTLCLPRRCGR